MFQKLRSLFAGRQDQPAPQTAVPPGERVYAIGDIHGRLDLFSAMIERIEADDAARGAAKTTVILLGDLVEKNLDTDALEREGREALDPMAWLGHGADRLRAALRRSGSTDGSSSAEPVVATDASPAPPA